MLVHSHDRRRLLAAAALSLAPRPTLSEPTPTGPLITRTIARSGEKIPAVGMGTWLTFDIGRSAFEFARRRRVLETFYAGGGRMIDSSPMYGRAEVVVGELIAQLGSAATTFAATKVWNQGRDAGVRQMLDSLQLWGLKRFDLLQIHNMLTGRPTWRRCGSGRPTDAFATLASPPRMAVATRRSKRR